ncbi:MAG: hypothetical protein JNK87_25980 [Bryobacterales bacterium]|nr:hypothetical protein [Bryobacterales bacterium]
MKKVLAECRGAAEAASIDYPQLAYPFLEKEMKLATLIPLQRMCALADVSRAGFYRWGNAPDPIDRHMDLRHEIQSIALEYSCYGWRRVKRELDRRLDREHKLVVADTPHGRRGEPPALVGRSFWRNRRQSKAAACRR